MKQQIANRSERIVFVEEPPLDGSAKITLTRVGSGVLVRLSWMRQGGAATGREFSALNCAEATEAAALVIAITFDPSVPGPDGTREPEVDPLPTQQGSSQADSRAANAPTPAAEPDADQEDETQPLAIPATDAGAPTQKGRKSADHGLRLRLVTSVEGIDGVAPAAMEGFGIGTALILGEGLLTPEVRLTFTHFLGLTYPAQGGDAVFELDTARLALCPLRIGTQRYSLHPCASGTGGRLAASGRDTNNPQSHMRPLWLVGALVAGSFRPVSILVVTGEVALSAPVARDRFQFAPEQFHQVSSLILSGSLGMGVEFP